MKTTLTIIVLIVLAFSVLYMINSKSNSSSVLDPETFKQMRQDDPGVVIDVRTRDEYQSGHLKLTDYNFDLLNGSFENQIENLDKNKTYYLYCRTGNRSGKAAKMMKNKDFENVYNIGGFSSLANAGFETE